jgi:hypothetical protein
MKTKAYLNKEDPGHKAMVARVKALYERMGLAENPDW